MKEKQIEAKEKRGERRGCIQLRMVKFVFCYIWSTASTELFSAEAHLEEGWFGLSGRSDCSFQNCNWPRWVPTSAGSHRAGLSLCSSYRRSTGRQSCIPDTPYSDPLRHAEQALIWMSTNSLSGLSDRHVNINKRLLQDSSTFAIAL